GPQPGQAVLTINGEGVAPETCCRSEWAGKGTADVIERLAEGRPIEVGFDTEHEGAGLPVVAGLAAADESSALRSETAREPSINEGAIDSRIRVEDRRVPAAARPDAAGVHTDVEPGPGERRRHEYRRRRLFSSRKVCRLGRHRPHSRQRHNCDAIEPTIGHFVVSAVFYDAIRFHTAPRRQSTIRFETCKSIRHSPWTCICGAMWQNRNRCGARRACSRSIGDQNSLSRMAMTPVGK